MKQPRDFSLHGAIDLGARQAAAQRRQRAAEQASSGGRPGGGDGLIIEVTDESFNTDVVERSRTVPVVLDLWAEWCGPCKQLGPILEKIAIEANGAFVLAKVDVDANPQLSAALQVQSIPMVVAIIGGQVADGFLGALPEAQVRQWLGQVMQVAQQIGLRPPADADGSPIADGADGAGGPDDLGDGVSGGDFDAAQDALERGDFDAAAAAFQRVLAASPGDPDAETGLLWVEFFRRVDSYPDKAAVRREAAERPGDAQAQARMADIDLAEGRVEEAFDRLLATIRRTSGDERDAARVHLVSLFSIFPAKDPRVAKARTALSSLLF